MHGKCLCAFSKTSFNFPAQSCAKAMVVRRFREAKVLLVDEVSMLSPALLEVRSILLVTFCSNMILNCVFCCRF